MSVSMLPADMPGTVAAKRLAQQRRHAAELERPIQRATIDLIQMMGFHAVHIPNGVALGGSKLARAKQMAVLKADGLRPGFPDLHVIGRVTLPYGGSGYLETKRLKGGVLSDDQIWWRAELLRLGHAWHLVTKPEDAAAAFRMWGWR